MSAGRRVKYVLLLALVIFFFFLLATGGIAEGDTMAQLGLRQQKTTIRLWYSDEALTDYLNIRAVAYNESHDDVRIEPQHVTGVEMLEEINRASLAGENYPDLYIITNDQLEKAQLSGLTTDIGAYDPVLNAAHFPDAALNAVTYHGRYVAYPFYYETSVLMYNRTYLEQLVRSELNVREDADVSAMTTEEGVPMADEIAARIEEKVPLTIAGMLDFASGYSAPASVEGVFKWDVTDIFYNYFIIGEYMNAGGPAGDDITLLDLYNSEMVSCLKAYQQLNTYFAIDASSVNYDSVIEDFIDGKMVFTVVTSDAVTRIRSAQEEGRCTFAYGAADIPGLNDYYGTRTMSVTDCIVVNGYSAHGGEAQDFARFLAGGTDETMFRLTGKMPARTGIYYEDEILTVFDRVYAESVPMPKMIETSNLWMRLEIAFTQIWNGADCNLTLKDMSENMMKQVVGRHYEEMLLPEPDAVSISDETAGD